MAVTTSNGDGFALYNGVKLPNIDSVWTDKETYPYAAISGGADFGYMLICTKVQPIHYGDGDVEIRNTATTVYLGTLLPEETEWAVFGEDNFNGNGSYVVASSGMPIFWTNTDILNTDNTVYLAASAPIPLDGMNVIEWDGDTTGLEIDGSNYRVYDSISTSSMISVYKRTDSSLVVGTYFEDFADFGIWVAGLNSEELPWVFGDDNGTWFLKEAGTPNNSYCCLIAYPASGGDEGDDEDDDEGDTIPKEKHYCCINGTIYEVEGGTAKMGGTFCEVKSGTVLIDGTVYDFALN